MRFEKGKSGNPNGRPKQLSFREYIEQHPDKDAMYEAAHKSLLYHLRKKNVKVTTWYFDQMHGKAAQLTEITSPEDRPLEIIIGNATNKD